MAELELSGIVQTMVWDMPDKYGTVLIGDRDLLEAIEEAFGDMPRVVTVAIADERYEGELFSDQGSRGYSEWTPADAAELTVGLHNIIEVLSRHSGQTVTIWIADEPLDLARRTQAAVDKAAAEFRALTAHYSRLIAEEQACIAGLTAQIERRVEIIERLSDTVRWRLAGEDAKDGQP